MASRQAEALPEQPSDPAAAAAVPDDDGPEPRPAFRYEMTAPAAAAFPRPVEDGSGLAHKPLVRAPRKVHRAGGASGQRVLELQSLPGAPVQTAESVSEPSATDVDREILFSRVLCGSIDISLPILIGFLFTIAGSWILNFDYFLSAALEWAAAFSLFFFFFNSFFFLLLMGQTPGMYFTELRLVAEDGEAPATLRQVTSRILLFVPSAVSMIGLAWSLKDPHCRTAHDLWSGTRVEVLEE